MNSFFTIALPTSFSLCKGVLLSILLETSAWLVEVQFSSVQLLSCVRLFVTPWIAACRASLSITNSWSSLKLMSIESVMPSSHLILCHPLLFLPPIPSTSGSFPMSQLFAWGGQSTGVSALSSVLPMNTQDWSPLEWTGWISLQSKGLSRVFLWLLNLNCYSLLIWSKPIFCWRNNWYSLCYNITLSHFLGGGNIRSLILYKLLKISYDFSAKIPHQFFI